MWGKMGKGLKRSRYCIFSALITLSVNMSISLFNIGFTLSDGQNLSDRTKR